MTIKLVFFISLLCVVAACIIVPLKFKNDALTWATIILALATTAYASILFWDKWVAKPSLKILYDPNKADLHKPYQHMPYRDKWTTDTGEAFATVWDNLKFLRVEVTNDGSATAKNCWGVMEVIGRPDDCPVPSDEPKGLFWAGRDPKQPTDIAVKGRAILNVLCSYEHFRIDIWGGEEGSRERKSDKWGALKAWATTHDVFTWGPKLRWQDAFCRGEYIVKLLIYAENADPKEGNFKLKIGDSWDDIDIGSV